MDKISVLIKRVSISVKTEQPVAVYMEPLKQADNVTVFIWFP